ncbi:MAG: glucose 1-dehydrogenase [Betaproteobacteria bacterium]|nr:MAG: glucose 1-dehydrogenase [Betaproteobacteria bacterium]
MPAVHPFDLSGRRALITGGGSGLGFAIAQGLARAGAEVIVNGRNVDKLESAKRTLAAEGYAVHAAPFDVTVSELVSGAIEDVERRLGPLDIVVNNAAVNRRAPLPDFSDEQWRAVMTANLDAAFYVARAVVPGMQTRRHGKIINICSLASDIGRPNIVPYAASKGGLRMLTRALAVELAPFNVQVNGIAPGFFKTEMNAVLIADTDFSAWVAKRTPAGRWGDPPEVAGAAVFLASDAADYVTGHILYVDGGFSAAY